MSKISLWRIKHLMGLIHKKSMATLARHNASPEEGALVMEAYQEYLATDFQKEITERLGIEYPLNIKSIEEAGAPKETDTKLGLGEMTEEERTIFNKSYS